MPGIPQERQNAARSTPDLPETPTHFAARSRALLAWEAGEYLAHVLGRPSPFTAQQMWAWARADQIPAVRIGRRVYFRTESLDAFVESGGSPRPEGKR